MTEASRTMHLDEDDASFVDVLVRSGRYAEARDVVQAGLDALRERDDVLEAWLREDVVPVAAALMADPSRAVPIEHVSDAILRHHRSRTDTERRGP